MVPRRQRASDPPDLRIRPLSHRDPRGPARLPFADGLAGEVAGRAPAPIEHPQVRGSSGDSWSGSCRPLRQASSGGGPRGRGSVATDRLVRAERHHEGDDPQDHRPAAQQVDPEDRPVVRLAAQGRDHHRRRVAASEERHDDGDERADRADRADRSDRCSVPPASGGAPGRARRGLPRVKGWSTTTSAGNPRERCTARRLPNPQHVVVT